MESIFFGLDEETDKFWDLDNYTDVMSDFEDN